MIRAPTYFPKANTVWRHVKGLHRGATARIYKVTKSSVFYTLVDASAAAQSKAAKNRKHRESLDMFLVTWAPATARDERECFVDEAAAVALVDATPEVQAAPAEEEPMPPTTRDTNMAGDQFDVPFATKRCPSCGEVKMLGLFSRNHSTKDGLQAHCKECQKKYWVAQAERNRQQKESTVLTTTSNTIIESRPQVQNATPPRTESNVSTVMTPTPVAPTPPTPPAAPPPAAPPADPEPPKGKTWLVRARIFEEREWRVTANSYREAGQIAEGAAQEVEIISLHLED